ncbi:MAG: hypothetical protein WCO13_11300 [Bacteroidota bacterium]
MSQYIFEGKYKNNAGDVIVKLLLFHFEDDNKIHFIYSPHLDLTGYGNNFAEAKTSFGIVFEDFVDYTLKKKTIGKVLSGLGWELKGSSKKPKKIIAPSITSVINDNKFISEIFDKYPVTTYHQEVGLPFFI